MKKWKFENISAPTVFLCILFVLVGCGGSDGTLEEGQIWPDIDLEEFKSLQRFDELDWETLSPVEGTTYWELRLSGFPINEYDIIASGGNKCSEADDYEGCISEFDALSFETSSSNIGYKTSSDVDPRFHYIGLNQGNDNRLLYTLEDLILFLGEVDSDVEAVFLVEVSDYYWYTQNKEVGAVQEVIGGYRVIALKLVNYCTPVQENRFLLRIDNDGTIDILREQVLSRDENSCV